MVLASAKPETLGWRLRRGAFSFYITEIISAPFQPVKDLLACPARAERKDRALPRACGRPWSERKLGELANPRRPAKPTCPGRPTDQRETGSAAWTRRARSASCRSS